MQKLLEKTLSKVPDSQILYLVLALVFCGFLVQATAASGAYLFKQALYFLIAFGVCIFIYQRIDIDKYHRLAPIIYWLNIALLVVLKIFGSTTMGAQRWLKLGPVSLQPSELAKICLIIVLAAWLSKRPINNYYDIMKAASIVALPAAFVLLQPDLGTTLVYIAISLGMFFWAGASITQLLVLISPLITAICASVGPKIFRYQNMGMDISLTVAALVFVLILVVAVFSYYQVWRDPWRMFGVFVLLAVNIGAVLARPFLWDLLKEYQQKRLTIFLDPHSDPLGAGYHIIQSLYAIGSGGFLGKGFHNGELTQGNFVPEQHTDFAFSSIGEEIGLLGTLAVVVLYTFLCLKIIQTASRSHNQFNSLISIGIVSMFLFHIFVNIGMNLSLMPITGVPLPFISYGGTSMLVDLFLMVLVMKVVQGNQRDSR